MSGTPFEAKNNAGTVVTKSSSTTLNFISERYFFIDPNSTLANLINNYSVVVNGVLSGVGGVIPVTGG